jgi:glutathione S-transferase
MKLYYSPGACSLSPHIALRESGLPFELVLASTKTHQLADGTDYYTINPKGSVPLLELDNGERLSEGPAIVQYIADQVPAKGLAPAAGTMARYRLMEWLNFITSELHKGFSPLFNPAMPEEGKALARAQLSKRLAWVDEQLAGKDYLLGATFTVADPYLFTVAGWGKYVGVDISGLANLNAYLARVAARPAVQEALKAEGLLK